MIRWRRWVKVVNCWSASRCDGGGCGQRRCRSASRRSAAAQWRAGLHRLRHSLHPPARCAAKLPGRVQKTNNCLCRRRFRRIKPGVFTAASACQAELTSQLGRKLPLLATGHLTTVGASTSESVREIYVGALEAFPTTAFRQPITSRSGTYTGHKSRRAGTYPLLRFAAATSFEGQTAERSAACRSQRRWIAGRHRPARAALSGAGSIIMATSLRWPGRLALQRPKARSSFQNFFDL